MACSFILWFISISWELENKIPVTRVLSFGTKCQINSEFQGSLTAKHPHCMKDGGMGDDLLLSPPDNLSYFTHFLWFQRWLETVSVVSVWIVSDDRFNLCQNKRCVTKKNWKLFKTVAMMNLSDEQSLRFPFGRIFKIIRIIFLLRFEAIMASFLSMNCIRPGSKKRQKEWNDIKTRKSKDARNWDFPRDSCLIPCEVILLPITARETCGLYLDVDYYGFLQEGWAG